MKTRRIIVLIVILVFFASLASVMLVRHWQHSEQTFKVLPRIATEEQRYVHDQLSQGLQLPASVSLQDLVHAGYTSTDEVRSLGGAEVTFYPVVVDTTPQAIMVRVRMPDGTEIVALADGSINQVTK